MLRRVEVGVENARLEGFELFWSVYPRKVGKLDAIRAWNSTKKYHLPIEQMIAAVNKLSTTCDDLQFCPYPASWLRDGRFLDE